MVSSGPDSAANTGSLRHLDTMTTLTLGQSMQMLEEDADEDNTACEMPGQRITMDKVCAHFYFSMQFDEDLPTGCQLEIQVPGSDAFLQWLDRAWAPEPDSFTISQELVWKAFPSSLNPYERQHVLSCIASVNKAWQAVQVYTDLGTKTRRLRLSINEQVNGMIQRFQEAKEEGMINESSLQKKILTAERWRRSKTTEILQHLHEKEEDAMAAVLEASPLLTQLFDTYRSKMQAVMENAGTDSQLDPDREDDKLAPGASFEEDMDEELLVLELEDAVQEDVRGLLLEKPTQPVKDCAATYMSSLGANPLISW